MTDILSTEPITPTTTPARTTGADRRHTAIDALMTAVDALGASTGPHVEHTSVVLGEERHIVPLVGGLHAVNADLWDAEDEARRPGADDSAVAAAKRRIDRLNLRRHAFAEAVDDWVFAAVPMSPTAELHTEAIGIVVDRLSVLTLREAHYRRGGSGTEGVLVNVRRQRGDLLGALATLLRQCADGQRRVQLYRAHKAYGRG
ncbi:DUF4254 domain-containing protein [Kitasatospora sp. NPDC097643]|uniref:DUF4254 domain-containing protein n=1 Tax=Kitasatospora sp. NPDC097643 TaxID=3157230 RepID=UPI00331C8CBF